MKIVLTGGGTGGHFYPIIAVAQEINNIVSTERLAGVEMFFVSTEAYNEGVLFDNNIVFKKVPAGKRRRYFSILNFIDVFKTVWGILVAINVLFKIYPDVVFAKGGFSSFPTLVAARILRIPVIIHESDTVPGRVNKWAGKFAMRIATGFPDTLESYRKYADKVAYTGNPVRKELQHPVPEGAHEFLKLNKNIPVILVLGGSQGAEVINDNLMDALPGLVERFQVIHQTGESKLEAVKEMSHATLLNNKKKDRYKMFPYLNTLALRMAAGASDIVISRAGAGAISEISSWGVPSIIIPITDSNGDHQRQNAFSYARTGACSVIEERNLTHHIIVSEVQRLIDNKEDRTKMSKAAKAFSKTDAGSKIAREIIHIGLSHESA